MRNRSALISATAMVSAAAGVALAAGPAAAAQSTQTVQCGGQTFVVRTNNNNSSQNGGWGAAQVVSGDAKLGIPTSFSGVATDVTKNTQLFAFSSQKANGNANHNQQTTTCTETQTGTLLQLFGPPPPGIDGTDQGSFTLTVTVVIK